VPADPAQACSFFKTYVINVRRKADLSVVTNASWISLATPISQTTPQLRIATSPGDTALEGKYYVKITSYLIAEQTFRPEFEFEVYLNPHPCLLTSLVGPASIADLPYKIEITPTMGTVTFPKFTSTLNNAVVVDSCTPLKYSIAGTNATLISFLTIDASTNHTPIATTPALVFSVADAATNIKLNWGPTEIDSL
jgi:hypothetical protein